MADYNSSFTGPQIDAALTKAQTATQPADLAAAIAAGGSRGIFHARDEKPSGTQGGSTTADTTITRVLNSVVTNTITGASLSANVITLPEGMYVIDGLCPSHRADGHKAHLYNVTDAVVAIQGQNSFSSNTNSVLTNAPVRGAFIVPSGGRDYEVRHYFRGGRATTGLGLGVPNSGVEIYSNILIFEA